MTDHYLDHHYCFVDMNSAMDVDAAVQKLHGYETEWGPLRVGQARDNQYRKPQGEGYQRRERDGGRVEERGSWR